MTHEAFLSASSMTAIGFAMLFCGIAGAALLHMIANIALDALWYRRGD